VTSGVGIGVGCGGRVGVGRAVGAFVGEAVGVGVAGGADGFDSPVDGGETAIAVASGCGSRSHVDDPPQAIVESPARTRATSLILLARVGIESLLRRDRTRSHPRGKVAPPTRDSGSSGSSPDQIDANRPSCCS